VIISVKKLLASSLVPGEAFPAFAAFAAEHWARNMGINLEASQKLELLLKIRSNNELSPRPQEIFSIRLMPNALSACCGGLVRRTCPLNSNSCFLCSSMTSSFF